MTKNEYLPFLSTIKKIIQHTDIEYTFRMTYEGDVKPGQFFEVSMGKRLFRLVELEKIMWI